VTEDANGLGQGAWREVKVGVQRCVGKGRIEVVVVDVPERHYDVGCHERALAPLRPTVRATAHSRKRLAVLRSPAVATATCGDFEWDEAKAEAN
jgi:hypothetical protein